MTPNPPPANPPPPIPPPVPVETHPNRAGGLKPPIPPQPFNPNRLSPGDAYYATSPPRLRPQQIDSHGRTIGSALGGSSAAASAAAAALRPPPAVPLLARRARERERVRSASRKRKGTWKKLLWVKQSYPDNYTDIDTFLDHLQRNPRLRLYDFWSLVADSTVIVQHVASVVIFVCCFAGIIQDKISPVSVLGWGSLGTILGWVCWDSWVWKEEEELAKQAMALEVGDDDDNSSSSSTGTSYPATSHSPNPSRDESRKEPPNRGLGLTLSTTNLPGYNQSRKNSATSATSVSSFYGVSPQSPYQSTNLPPHSPYFHPYNTNPLFPPSVHNRVSPRTLQRVRTAKSALLIFFALLGLSPILKSLTKSTTSDSIWAMSTWLMIINIFFFDYSVTPASVSQSKASPPQRPGRSTVNSSNPTASNLSLPHPDVNPAALPQNAARFPASLSTNAALMASTVLASRLPSVTHVFSLTLFSIEVFGLFPVFRRHLRAHSWSGHVALTVFLVVAATGGVGHALRGGLTGVLIGVFVGCIGTTLVMGGCSWWLIGLQRYKNVVIGPWDPARPVLRRHWD